MDTINRRYVWLFFSIILIIMAGAYILNTIKTPILTKPGYLQSDAGEQSSSYFVIKNTAGDVILQTGLTVQVDDQYIDEHNVHYIVTQVKGEEAIADIVSSNETATETAPADIAINIPLLNPSIPVQAAPGTHIVLYHTHTDESYAPTSGTSSQRGAGDIFTVGKVLADSLRKSGVSVTHSTNAHDPHDINAYHRSRKTMAQLLKEQPDAAFDIHRDSTPPSTYATSINGIDTAKVMIVVGRSNPNMRTNLNYARTVKAKADSLYPGLIRGIFLGRGSYNQDLYPTALLFEIGTSTGTLVMAENGARFLGDIITHVISGI